MKLEEVLPQLRAGREADVRGFRYRIKDGVLENTRTDVPLWGFSIGNLPLDGWTLVRREYTFMEAFELMEQGVAMTCDAFPKHTTQGVDGVYIKLVGSHQESEFVTRGDRWLGALSPQAIKAKWHRVHE